MDISCKILQKCIKVWLQYCKVLETELLCNTIDVPWAKSDTQLLLVLAANPIHTIQCAAAKFCQEKCTYSRCELQPVTWTSNFVHKKKRTKEKSSIVNASFPDRSHQACGPTVQQEQNSEKLPSNRCNYPQSTVSSRLAEKSTHRQASFRWVGRWLLYGEKKRRKTMPEKKTKEEKIQSNEWEKKVRGEWKRREDKTAGTKRHKKTEHESSRYTNKLI